MKVNVLRKQRDYLDGKKLLKSKIFIRGFKITSIMEDFRDTILKVQQEFKRSTTPQGKKVDYNYEVTNVAYAQAKARMRKHSREIETILTKRLSPKEMTFLREYQKIMQEAAAIIETKSNSSGVSQFEIKAQQAIKCCQANVSELTMILAREP